MTQAFLLRSSQRPGGTDLARDGSVLRAATLVAALLVSASEDPAVPAELQAELLARVLRHDRQLVGEPTEVMSVLVVHSGEPGSLAAARKLLTALREQPTIGGRKHAEALFLARSHDELITETKRTQARVIIFAPGTPESAEKVARALDGQPVFTVSMTTEGVAAGVLLGFQLDEGKPRMWLNLQQARRQGSDLRAEVIKLMKVVP